jgi:hypothetical protein
MQEKGGRRGCCDAHQSTLTSLVRMDRTLIGGPKVGQADDRGNAAWLSRA